MSMLAQGEGKISSVLLLPSSRQIHSNKSKVKPKQIAQARANDEIVVELFI
jgi:hypothetical protein